MKEDKLMKKHVKDAAVIAFVLIIIKLALRLIPPADRFFSLFEDGIWLGLGIILLSYILLFFIVLIVLVVSKKWKKRDRVHHAEE